MKCIPFHLALLVSAAVFLMLQVSSVAATHKENGRHHVAMTAPTRFLRSGPYDASELRRRMEDANDNNQNDDNAQGGDNQDQDNSSNTYYTDAGDTFVDMFVTSPSSWTPLEWGIFVMLLVSFGICFFCWCVVCIVPQCCGHRAAMAYAAMS